MLAEKIAESKTLEDGLRMEIERLSDLLRPASDHDVKACLAKLILHYPMTTMTSHEKTLLLEDYVEELRRYPALMIADVCRSYRMDPTNQFFPKVAILASSCSLKRSVIVRKKSTIEKALEAAKRPKQPSMTVEEMEAIKARFSQPEMAPREATI